MANLLFLGTLPLLSLFFLPSSWFTAWPTLRQVTSFPHVIFHFTSNKSLAFDPREATISSTHYALYNGLTTCRSVVSSYLSRIESLNEHTNAIISLNPEALNVADEMDAQLRAGLGRFGPLFCIPTLLKDNFDTKDMPTTDGSLALANSRPSRDAASVVALKEAGSVILGKSNLHELALEGLTVSSVAGQTINPYDSTRTPGGSSGGTGAAVAASFSVWGTGSDTVNSLRSPASANSLFTCRPTRGLISRAGIVPVSYIQDSIGPITRNIEDLATTLTVMASMGYDSRDNTTALVPANVRGTDYTASLKLGSLKDLRFGVVEGFFDRSNSPETNPVNNAMAETTAKLESAGAVLVPITDPMYNSPEILKLDVQRYSYREVMDNYLQQPELKGGHPSGTVELFSKNSKDFLVVPSGYDYVRTALVSSTSNASYASAVATVQNLTLALQNTFAQNELDALIYPEQSNLVMPIGSYKQSGRNGILAALTGSPVVALPAGFSDPTATAPDGVPIGLEILGRPFTEELLLKIAYQIERLHSVRKPPRWALEWVDAKEYESVPVVVPDRNNIVKAYPVGTLPRWI